MREQLIALDNRLQPFLTDRNYSFIAPIDQNLLQPFIERVNRIAPTVALSRSIHHALGNRQATRRVLDTIPADIPLRIYVVTIVQNDSILMQETIEDFCRNNNIDFNQLNNE